MSKTIILGGGLAGLSAAYHVQGNYELFECQNTAGGVAGSFTINGFTFDHAIHILYTKDPYASNLIRSLLKENFSVQERSSWIYSYDTYTPYPYQANMKGLPLRIIWENISGLFKTKFMHERTIENFEEWISARFGSGIAKNFMLPFNRKVWAAEPQTMSFDWVAGRVPVMRFRDTFKGAIMRNPNHNHDSPNATFWYPIRGGTGALPQSFLSHVHNIHVNERCIGIDPVKRLLHFESGYQQSYQTVICSLPLPLVVKLIKGVPDHIVKASHLLRANRVTTVNLGIAREHISDKHWVYFPEKKYLFQRISFPMNFSPSLVPHGASSIMAEISSPVSEPAPEPNVIEETINQLKEIGILRHSENIPVKKIIHIDPAYIIYDQHHHESVAEIHRYLRSISIIPCGRFGEWEYLNMDQTILSGKNAAESVAHLS